VDNSTLARWDASSIQPGPFTIRLTLFGPDNPYTPGNDPIALETRVRLTLLVPTPTPTSTPTITPTPSPTDTPRPTSTDLPTATPIPSETPDLTKPTLTPTLEGGPIIVTIGPTNTPKN